MLPQMATGQEQKQGLASIRLDKSQALVSRRGVCWGQICHCRNGQLMGVPETRWQQLADPAVSEGTPRLGSCKKCEECASHKGPSMEHGAGEDSPKGDKSEHSQHWCTVGVFDGAC
jgi:hypothetical protein